MRLHHRNSTNAILSPRRWNLHALAVHVRVRVEPYEHDRSMAQVFRNFHYSSVLANAFVLVVSVLINLDYHDVTAEVGEHVGTPARATALDFFVTRPVDDREPLLDVMRHGGLFGLVVARDFLVWEKVHEAVHAVPSVLGVLSGLAPLALAKR